MLHLTIPDREVFDDTAQEFRTLRGGEIRLEHSLSAISKWEAKFRKPFFGKSPKTITETVEYVKCMTLPPEPDPGLYGLLRREQFQEIEAYISDPMTATWFSQNADKSGSGCETVTSELVYYWMIALGIPFECQDWHFNRLKTLIRVCLAKQEKPKRMGQRELASRNAALNAARRAKLHSRG